MNLGTKNLNNLLSKDFKTAQDAALCIIDENDTLSYKKLTEKTEFIFDFIKTKIIKKLSDAVNENNVFNLFNFMKYYSADFSSFITASFIKYKTKEITQKMLEMLDFGIEEEKTHAFEFFKKTKDVFLLDYAKKYAKSSFFPLKEMSILFLKESGNIDEYNKRISILSSSLDDFEKIQAVEFLAVFGDKNAFSYVYEYFLKNQENEIIASNLLLIKSFEELIEEDNSDAVLNIYSSLLYNFPDNITFDEIDFYLNSGLFDYLFEINSDYPFLLNVYLKNKTDILSDEVYSVDLSKDDKTKLQKLKSRLNDILFETNIDEFLEKALFSDIKIQNLIALDIILFEKNCNQVKNIETLCKKTNDNEIILKCLDTLMLLSSLKKDFIFDIENRVENLSVKEEIKRFYASISV